MGVADERESLLTRYACALVMATYRRRLSSPIRKYLSKASQTKKKTKRTFPRRVNPLCLTGRTDRLRPPLNFTACQISAALINKREKEVPQGTKTTGHSSPFAVWIVEIATRFQDTADAMSQCKADETRKERTGVSFSASEFSKSVESIDAWRNTCSALCSTSSSLKIQRYQLEEIECPRGGR